MLPLIGDQATLLSVRQNPTASVASERDCGRGYTCLNGQPAAFYCAPSCRARLTTRILPASIVVWSDRERILHVLFNLDSGKIWVESTLGVRRDAAVSHD